MAKILAKWTSGIAGDSWIKEIPSGLINGTNKEFVLTQNPKSAASVSVFLDSLNDEAYTLDIPNKKITFTTAPVLGQDLIVKYSYVV